MILRTFSGFAIDYKNAEMEEWIVFCPKCGEEITNAAKFCPYCGAQFRTDPAAESPAGAAPSAPDAPNALAGPVASGPAGSVSSGSESPAGAAPGSPAGPAPFTPEPPADCAQPAPESPVYTAPAGDNAAFGASAVLADGRKKRPGTGLIIGGAVAVMAVLLLAVAAVSGLFSSPRDQLTKALEKTFAAYAGAREGLDIPDLSEYLQYNSCSRRVSLSIDSIGQEVTSYYPEMSALKGLGFRMDTDLDRDSRKMDADLAIFWSGQDLLSFQILVDDNKLYLASPDLTGGKAYGFNTETFGADLVKLGAADDADGISSISFNLFDLPEESASDGAKNEEMAAAGAEAGRRLLDAIEVEKGGKENIGVNGWSVDATVYYVVVPRDAMHDYIDAVEDALNALDTVDAMEEMLGSMGLDESTIQDMTAEMGDTDAFGYGELVSELRDAVNSIGDLELKVYVSGGYVSAVEYADRIDGTEIGFGLYLGGGANYVDDWSLEIKAGGEELTVESTGDHGGRSGVFTDETTIRVDSSRLTSVLRYEPEASHDNFEWELKVDNSASIAIEGQLTLTDESMELQLDELSLQSAWSRLLTLKGSFYLGPYEGTQVSFSSPQLLAEMDSHALMDVYLDIMDRMDVWASDVLLNRIPPELLYSLYE